MLKYLFRSRRFEPDVPRCIPGTQMGPLVLIIKGLVFKGPTAKTKGHMGSRYIEKCFIYLYTPIFGISMHFSYVGVLFFHISNLYTWIYLAFLISTLRPQTRTAAPSPCRDWQRRQRPSRASGRCGRAGVNQRGSSTRPAG